MHKKKKQTSDNIQMKKRKAVTSKIGAFITIKNKIKRTSFAS